MAALRPTSYLTIDDVAAACKVSTRTVRRWIANGSLPASRVGPTLIRIRAEDLDALGERIPAAR